MKILDTDRPLRAAPAAPLAKALLEAWQHANGVPESRAEVLTGEDRYVILIEDAFTRAESQLARRKGGQSTLRQYVEGLMNVIGDQVLRSTGEVAGRRVHTMATEVNFEQGWVMWVVRLKGSGQ